MSKYPKITAVLEGRRVEQFANVVRVIEETEKSGEIYNADYNQIKEWASYCVKEAADFYVKTAYLAMERDSGERDALKDLYWLSWDVHLAPSVQKKLAKMDDNEPLVRVAKQLNEEILPLAKFFKEWKKKTIKGRKPNPDRVINPWEAPVAKDTESYRIVRDILVELTNKTRRELINSYVTQYTNLLKSYTVDSSELDADESINLARTMGIDFLFDISGSTYRYNDPLSIKERSDAANRIQARAKEDANAVIETFVTKNLQKLTSLIEAKGNLGEINIGHVGVTNGFIETILHVSFKDSSSFTVKSKIVFGTRSGRWTSDTSYIQYPTTFHNVVMPNGKKMPQPSEQRMHEVFAK